MYRVEVAVPGMPWVQSDREIRTPREAMIAGDQMVNLTEMILSHVGPIYKPGRFPTRLGPLRPLPNASSPPQSDPPSSGG